MQRVMVIGSPGAGKSTLARRLAEVTGLPLVHLDAEYWLPDWTEREPQEWQTKLLALAERERWIIDGNYGGSLALRLARADTVIWLDYPTGICLWRAVKRVTLGRGRVRADSAPACPERFDAAFLHYIATFRRRKRAKIARLLAEFSGQVSHFTAPRDAENWLVGLAAR